MQPFHLLVIALAGWLNRQQQARIDYLIAENRVLKHQLEGQRPRFTDERRLRLAVKAKVPAYSMKSRRLCPWVRCLPGTGSSSRSSRPMPGRNRVDPASRNRSRSGTTHGEGKCLVGLRPNPRRTRQSRPHRGRSCVTVRFQGNYEFINNGILLLRPTGPGSAIFTRPLSGPFVVRVLLALSLRRYQTVFS